ncbi:hypothetical protein AAVH_17713 [Aphelenchoides avenae]|nr:hypothetical protein AAVH_17713 [Aphelenchus avenae]
MGLIKTDTMDAESGPSTSAAAATTADNRTYLGNRALTYMVFRAVFVTGELCIWIWACRAVGASGIWIVYRRHGFKQI